jgi:hypothetical protein
MTNNAALTALAWLALTIHLVVGVVVLRRAANPSLLPLLNLIAAGCVLAYWGRRWFGYLFRSITWYASDQLIPLAALVVAIMAILTLSGRYHSTTFHWLVYGLDTLVLIGAVLFLTFFRMNRLI